MREKTIEQYLVESVKRNGGQCYKWVSPGNDGVPDRIVIFKSIVSFVELKTDGGKLSAKQIVQHRKLGALDFEVAVLWTKDQVKAWVELTAETSRLLQ